MKTREELIYGFVAAAEDHRGLWRGAYNKRTDILLVFLSYNIVTIYCQSHVRVIIITEVTGELRETFRLQQRIGLAIQRGNAFSILTDAARERGAT